MTGPTVTVVDDGAELEAVASARISSVIRANPALALVVATGRTPIGTYRQLARTARSGLDVSGVRVFQLDEYLGVGPGDERSLLAWTMRSFASPLGIAPDRLVGFDATCSDPARACRDYDAAVAAAGGFDLAILGLGPNGHVGFNEPPSDPSAPTRVVRLSAESVASNASYWHGLPIPEHALTAGLSLLFSARHVVLLVSGTGKRDILSRTLHEPATPQVPASFLQHHPNAYVIADRAAAGGLPTLR